MDKTEKTIKAECVYKGVIFSVRSDEAALPDGRPCRRDFIEHNGGACVLYAENDGILFVKQYRYAYGEEIYEIPAGKLEQGEDPAIAAARELEEEAGIVADELTLLFTVYPSPGYTNEKIYVYEAKNGKAAVAHPDDGELLDVEYIPVDKVTKMLEEGVFRDAKTIIALQSYLLKRANCRTK